ncbi:MAG: response regulator, partial [Caldilinea sp.]|nr:response regulator [Caldilinea sp.]MDW8441798.1 response regulator [Caldilineaceae bacterium]
MNLLIVDDEKYAIQGILDGVAWERLEFKEVLTANSFAQAVEIFGVRRIDAMLCDIEMPMGSGLDLIEWVREHSPETVNIILSCHDRFDFARQAVKLQCFDYVMKPATSEALLEVLDKAIAEVKERRRQALLQEVGKQYAHIVAPAEESAGRASLAEQAAHYILAHIDEPLTVDDLADRLYVSADHL